MAKDCPIECVGSGKIGEVIGYEDYYFENEWVLCTQTFSTFTVATTIDDGASSPGSTKYRRALLGVMRIANSYIYLGFDQCCFSRLTLLVVPENHGLSSPVRDSWESTHPCNDHFLSILASRRSAG